MSLHDPLYFPGFFMTVATLAMLNKLRSMKLGLDSIKFLFLQISNLFYVHMVIAFSMFERKK